MSADLDDLIQRVEEIRADPDDHKDYENTYEDGWLDACYAVIQMLHGRKAQAKGDPAYQCTHPQGCTCVVFQHFEHPDPLCAWANRCEPQNKDTV